VLGLDSRIVKLESSKDGETAQITDRLAWDWYAESCSCGVPAGECRAHPRGRPSQRPPSGDWRVWAYVAGRGARKTRAGACWVQHRVEQGLMKVGCLIAPTANDIRDVMVEGQSGEYEHVFGTRLIGRWPQHKFLDGLDTIELLLETDNLTIHPRCARLKDAFGNYCKQRRGSEWLDYPADGHPEEDMMDALRGGIRDALPDGSVPTRDFARVHVSRLF